MKTEYMEFDDLHNLSGDEPGAWQEAFAGYPTGTEFLGFDEELVAEATEEDPVTEPEPSEVADETAGNQQVQSGEGLQEAGEPEPAPADDGGDLPPPEPPASGGAEQPDERPPFGVRRFTTDEEYRFDVPAGRRELHDATIAAHRRRQSYRRIVVNEDDGSVTFSVNLECETPDGRVEFDVGIGTATAEFTPTGGDTDYHIYFPDDADMVYRYDPDLERHIELEMQTADAPEIEHGIVTPEEAAMMDIEMADAAHVVGNREMAYVTDLLEQAEPVAISIDEVKSAVATRMLSEEPISDHESITAGMLAEQFVREMLGDETNGYTVTSQERGFAGVKRIEEADGNFIQVGLNIHRVGETDNSNQTEIRIDYTDPHYLTASGQPMAFTLIYQVDGLFKRTNCISVLSDIHIPTTSRPREFTQVGVAEVQLLHHFMRRSRRD